MGSGSEFQPDILVPALGADGGVGALLFRIKVVAADAVEGDPASLRIIKSLVPAIIIDPQKPDQAQHQQAIDEDIEGVTGRHGDTGTLTQSGLPAKGKEKRADPEVRRVET